MKIKRNILYIVAFIFSMIYLIWRVLYTLPLSDSLFAFIFGLLLWSSEVISVFTAFILIWSKTKEKKLIKPKLEGIEYPHVDIVIATHNEDIDILYKTVNACVHMEYPDLKKIHIYLSDDTNREEVKELAEQFEIEYIGLENNKHAKSGNLNNALKYMSSPLLATFDADMIPYSRFLTETVPYFLENFEELKKNKNTKKLGFIQTPQSFYNADIFQYNLFSESSITNEQDFFSREINVLNNAHDSAIYTGSNTLILRQAISDAGGFPINSITEDFQLGATINSCGYRSISTLEPMASGLTPMDFQTVLKQRIRWARGVIRSVYNLRILTNINFPFNQKIVFLNSYLYWGAFFRRILYVFAPILFTVFNIRVVDTNFWLLMLFWLPGYVLLQLSMSDVSSEIRPQRLGEIQETIFAPYLVIPVFLETIGISEKKFKVTQKNIQNSKYELLYMIPHIIMLTLSIIGLVKFNYGKFGSELLYGSVITFWLLHHSINLSYAILFSLGRPIYRKHERFFAEEAVTVKTQDQLYHLFTKNISEEGLSFYSKKPLYFPPNESISFNFESQTYPTKLTGRIIRVTSYDEGWLYGVKIDEPTEMNKRSYFQIIYDRNNKYLTRTHDSWMTPLDGLLKNIVERFSFKKNTKQPIYINPSFHINESIQVEKKHLILKDFRFDELTIQSKSSLLGAHYLVLPYRHVNLHLQLKNFNPDLNEYIYQVSNIQNLMENEQFQMIIKEWSTKV